MDSSAAPLTTRSLLRRPDFRRLWFGQTVSLLGSQVTMLALPLAALNVLGASPAQIGLLSAMETLPFLLVGLPAGAIVDRLRRRPILIAGDVGRAVALASIPIASAFDVLSLAQLLVVALVTGVCTVFFDVAWQSYLPAVVDRDELIAGNAALEISRSGSMIAGPGLAGLLVGSVGAVAAITGDAASFVLSALAIVAIRRPEQANPPQDGGAGADRRRLRTEVAEGVRYVFGHPILRPIACSTGTFNLFSSMLQPVLLVFVVRELGYGAGTLGLVFAAGNVAFLIGAAMVTRITRRLGLGRTLVWSSVVSAAGAYLLPLASGWFALPLLVAGMFLTSLGIPLYNINQVSLRQAITPDRLQGRMNATIRFMVWGTMPVGALLGGVLAEAIGLRPTLWVSALGGSLGFLWIQLSPVRSLQTIPSPAEPLPA